MTNEEGSVRALTLGTNLWGHHCHLILGSAQAFCLKNEQLVPERNLAFSSGFYPPPTLGKESEKHLQFCKKIMSTKGSPSNR